MIGPMSEAAEPVRRTLTQEEVDAVCLKHDRLWQARPGGARAVFAWMDLSGVNLRGRNLADADFTAACLIGCDLTGAKLDNANFFGADMQDVTLIDASLRRADLRGACLRGADLSGGDLFEADLREGTIAAKDTKLGFRVVEARKRVDTQAQGAVLAGANLQRSRMTGVIAVAADFTDAVMKDCKLVRANLKQASFRGADLAGADLSGADLSGRTSATLSWSGSRRPCGGPTGPIWTEPWSTTVRRASRSARCPPPRCCASMPSGARRAGPRANPRCSTGSICGRWSPSAGST